MHFEQISCFGDIYLDLVGILGIDDISTGRNIHMWTCSRILSTQIYKYMEDITIFEGQLDLCKSPTYILNIFFFPPFLL